MQDLKRQNQHIDETDEIKIVHQIETKTQKWIIFAEVKPKTFHKLMDKIYLNIGWKTCKVYEDIYIRICTKCNGYGHKYTECRGQVTCRVCGGNHYQKDCDKNHKCCSNCKFSNEKYNTNYDITHVANSEECSVYANQQRRARERVNYCIQVTDEN